MQRPIDNQDGIYTGTAAVSARGYNGNDRGMARARDRDKITWDFIPVTIFLRARILRA